MIHVLWAGIFIFLFLEFIKRFLPLKAFFYTNGVSMIIGLLFVFLWVVNETDGFSQLIGGFIIAIFFTFLLFFSGIAYLLLHHFKNKRQ
jgi:hypothetical protein